MGWERVPKVKKKRKMNDFDQKSYPDVMVDLETMGTETDTQVISIGAVRFRMGSQDDVETIMEPDRAFYARCNLYDQAIRGRTENPETAAWWADQSDAARAVFDEEEEDVAHVLKSFTRFCKGASRIWGNGNMFDNAIVRSLYTTYGQDYPVGYWKDLDVRTLTYLWNFLTNWQSKGKRPEVTLGEEHNALDDARRQVVQVQIMMNQLKGSKYES